MPVNVAGRTPRVVTVNAGRKGEDGAEGVDSTARASAQTAQITASTANNKADTNAAQVAAVDAKVEATPLIVANFAALDALAAQDVAVGRRVDTDDGLRYRRASDAASDHQITNSAGLKFYILTDAEGKRTFDAFGADNTGATDCAAILAAASAFGPLSLSEGSTYLIATSQSISSDLTLSGNATLSFTTTGDRGLTLSGDCRLNDLTVDGNNVSARPIYAIGDVCEIVNCKFSRFFQASPASDVSAVYTSGLSNLLVRDCEFSEIAAPANGIIGDNSGAVRAINVIAALGKGLIENCKFSDINNRATAGGTLQDEDADAIATNSAGQTQNLTVRGNDFRNCGKRAAKFNIGGDADSTYVFAENTGSSSYVSTPDNSTEQGNGMLAVVSVFGGSLTTRDNKWAGGVSLSFINGDASTGTLRSIKSSGDEYLPEYHRYVRTSQTVFIDANGFETGGSALVSGATSRGTYEGIRVEADNLTVAGCPEISSSTWGVNATVDELTITGTTFKQQSDVSPAVAGGGVVIQDGVVEFSISGCNFPGKYDAVNIVSQSASFGGAISGNNMSSVVRRGVTSNGGQDSVAFSANRGFVTENSGTVTKASAGVNESIAHGLFTTPTFATASFDDNTLGPASITAINSTNIVVQQQNGSTIPSGTKIYWQAKWP